MNLRSQRRIASRILKCGENRIWINPDNMEKVKQAITRNDIRGLIKDKIIKKLPVKKAKRIDTRKKAKQKLKGRRKGEGSRKGKFHARVGKKEKWLKIVRPQRRTLKELKDKKKIESNNYRKVYRMIKGGMFRSKRHLLSYLEEHDMIKK